MNYVTNFTAITTDGRHIPSNTIGIGYCNLHYAEGEINSGNIVPAPADEVVLHFTRVEDLLFDLYRHTDRKSFKFTQRIFNIGDDGEYSQQGEDRVSIVTLEDLQEFLVASYPDITLPAVFSLDLHTGQWRYNFSYHYLTNFEIS